MNALVRVSRPSLLAGLAALAACAWASDAAADETILPFAGPVPDDGAEFFLIPFDVPAGTVEIEIRHDDLSDANILDWGLREPDGAFRGWGGGNDEPAVVGVEAASRSYLARPIPTGTWNVVVGKAKIAEPPGQYQVEVVLRDAASATLAPQPERAPYTPAAPLSTEARWYAGDFHVHSRDSGDARPPLDEIADFARGRGLDFVHVSDHNTTAQLDFYADAQPRHPDLLFVPGVEFTTYAGHANGIGATKWVDHKIGFEGATIEAAAKAFYDQGALFSVNHPVLDLGDACIGCAWGHDLPADAIDAVEIATTGWSSAGQLFTEQAIVFWDEICATGRHAAALGGSDDHQAGENMGSFASPIGDPTTMVFATELSAAGILEGIRRGRTVVKVQGPGDPMVEIDYAAAGEGDTISLHVASLSAKITGASGGYAYWVKNGEPQSPVEITSDPFDLRVTSTAPPEGQDRWRVEVLVDGHLATVTSHVWHEDGPAAPAPASDASDSGGCGCRVPASPASSTWVAVGWALAALAIVRRRRLGDLSQ